ncbi:hypothetical protein Q5424_16100 [Conexibacter sp. JD483]|uniref:hypothetical protein n=1 Tax=unclassified Conexibacter TaxID=2627773 RepID=UPI00271C51E1|nr:MULTISPECIES: hypothetical protein [unclassified Conexibacter]MDO8187272.1 hypothetical protein [Conexibacter sp. CPCC 205706]MDO8198881.1 hypothetical protein [Conexibacter sp. CPCC 205762]MDR9370620.1 hypothetical protein [Conexibacter sp. JD483]
MDALPDPELEAEETTVFRATVDGEEVGGGTLTLRPEGERELVQAIAGEAFGRVSGTVETRFRRRGGELLAASQTIELRDRERELYRMNATFRDVQAPQMGGELTPYPREMVPAPALALALRALPLGERARFVPRVWLAAVVHWPLDMRVEKRERVTVPAGKLDCWRIRMRPSLLDVAQALDELSANVVPPLVAHVAVDGQRLVRLAFPTGPGRSDPPGLLEATELR